jgi:hypothetical protein
VLHYLRNTPFRAPVDFEKVYLPGRDCAEIRHEQYVGSFVFVFRYSVPISMIPVNPLGPTITYYRDDQAFWGGEAVITNSIFVAPIIFFAAGQYLAGELKFFAMYFMLILHIRCGDRLVRPARLLPSIRGYSLA